MNDERVLVGQNVEWVTIKKRVKPIYKTIKVLQIPSKKMMMLKELTQEPIHKNEGVPIFKVVKNYSKLLKDDKYKQLYCEKEDVKRDIFIEYTTKKGKVLKKLVK